MARGCAPADATMVDEKNLMPLCYAIRKLLMEFQSEGQWAQQHQLLLML